MITLAGCWSSGNVATKYMMRKYRVVYAGMPSGARVIVANSPREAALAFFAESHLRNSIIVKVGLLREEIFSWKDFLVEFPKLSSTELSLAVQEFPHENVERDPIIKIYRVLLIGGALLMLFGAWRISDRDVPWIGRGLLILSGLVLLVFGLTSSAKTLKRTLTREPSSLDAK